MIRGLGATMGALGLSGRLEEGRIPRLSSDKTAVSRQLCEQQRQTAPVMHRDKQSLPQWVQLMTQDVEQSA